MTTCSIAREGWPFIIGGPVLCLALGGAAAWIGEWAHAAPFAALAALCLGFMLWFFRDPHREGPDNPDLVLSGADGRVRSIELIDDPKHLGRPAVRVSVYLSPLDVHVNRCPVGGEVARVDYVPGKHLLTRSNESSEFNEHSTIHIRGEKLDCVVHQIVGPLVRRVVYWLDRGQRIARGQRLGLMKFGSRLDVYLPAEEVDVLVHENERVYAGLTAIAKAKVKVEPRPKSERRPATDNPEPTTAS